MNTQNERHCPKCGQLNLCQNIQSDTTSKCWCVAIQLSRKKQQEIEKYAGSKCCLCKDCIISLSE